MVPEIPQMSQQIHRLLAQPVHCGGSQGYSSLTSSGSHEQHHSVASSSESNGPALEDAVQLLKPVRRGHTRGVTHSHTHTHTHTHICSQKTNGHMHTHIHGVTEKDMNTWTHRHTHTL